MADDTPVYIASKYMHQRNTYAGYRNTIHVVCATGHCCAPVVEKKCSSDGSGDDDNDGDADLLVCYIHMLQRSC